MSSLSRESVSPVQPGPGPLPATVRAAVRRVYGGPADVSVEDVPCPTPGPGEVLVKVAAAGLDRATLHLLNGLPYLARLAFGLRRPQQPVLGQQLAGVVAALGPDVTDLAVGDRVFGTGRGTFAEYAVAKATILSPTPQTVADVDAATLGVSGMTALEAVVDHGQVSAGQRVLILGGSGAVGSFAVQLAAHRGAEVTAACSAAKRDFVQGLGARRTVDYRAVPLDAMGGPFDVIIDIAGNRRISALRSALTPEGRLVIVGGENGGPLLGGIQRNLLAAIANPLTRRELGWLFSVTTSTGCATLADLISAGAIRPALDRQVRLEGLAGALSAMERGELRGQAVVVID